ncbi:MAG: hypothetical protein BGO47_02565 [Microbacterium sp. 67-17]|nr:MAG: hypothetical protein BGO47_02565 [Microbacterium sp. 67-17]
MDAAHQRNSRLAEFEFVAENRRDDDHALPDALDLSRFTPRLLAILSNIFSLYESQSLRDQFGLGTTEWRILSAVALEPALTATEISKSTVMSKAVISRALTDLVQDGLLSLGDGPRGSRPIRITEEGAQMYRKMLPISYRAQEIINRTLGEEKLEQLHDLLTTLISAAIEDEAWRDGNE